MILEEYKTLEEKKPFFKNGAFPIYRGVDYVFDRIEEFENTDAKFIYRGCSEAKYKLYNSAQRFYINQELYLQALVGNEDEHYSKFIEALLESSKKWNGEVIHKLLKNAGIDLNDDLAYLSYMQHMGVPTPLLDFTYNPYVALFFAIDNLDYSVSSNEIDNYFSFYHAYEEATSFRIWQGVLSKSIEKDGRSYKTICKNLMGIIPQENKFYKIINSVNIINQDGLFFYNNDSRLPLERAYQDYYNMLIEEKGEARVKEALVHDTFAGCLNIHKSLIPAIREKLKEKGISSSTIYPDMNDFRQRVMEEGIFKSLNTDSNQLKIVYKE